MVTVFRLWIKSKSARNVFRLDQKMLARGDIGNTVSRFDRVKVTNSPSTNQSLSYALLAMYKFVQTIISSLYSDYFKTYTDCTFEKEFRCNWTILKLLMEDGHDRKG